MKKRDELLVGIQLLEHLPGNQQGLLHIFGLHLDALVGLNVALIEFGKLFSTHRLSRSPLHKVIFSLLAAPVPMFQDLANAENLPPPEVTFLIRVLKKLLSLNIGRSSDAYSQVQRYVPGVLPRNHGRL
ncbi:hypothetical protein [uncultured Stenotrophomonas sp.]|uniref:hypothetical protein n=1 Tax=uncultured Stenotrophomonas sp. TaxID=165438 RepID=UPI0028D017F2|nr:hypothetical protein [uncultured Stenotrophomonas sp.]